MSSRTPGVPSFDGNFVCYCFHCDLSAVRDLASELLDFQTVVARADGYTTLATKKAIRILRYVQCDWSLVVPIVLPQGMMHLQAMNILETFSRRLSVDALFLGIFDTANGAQYKYYRSGDFVESLTIEMEEARFESTECTPAQRDYGLDDIDQKVRDLGIIPALLWSPTELDGELALPLHEIDVSWREVADSLVMAPQSIT